MVISRWSPVWRGHFTRSLIAMIPEAAIAEWQNTHPWGDATLVEHDLILSRALCAIFQHPELSAVLRFRGGTAIHKLVMPKPGRFSEDLDLIYIADAGLKPMLKCLWEAMAWFEGEISYGRGGKRFAFDFIPTDNPTEPQRIKIEFNTTEKVFAEEPIQYHYRVDNPWYKGEAAVWSFPPEDLMGSKLHALLSRAKHRDLFDFYDTRARLNMDIGSVMRALTFYDNQRGARTPLTRAVAEERLLNKLGRPDNPPVNLTDDAQRLLRRGDLYTEDDALTTLAYVYRDLLPKLSGKPWRGAPEVLRLQAQRYPVLGDLAAAVAPRDPADPWQPGNG